MKAILAAAFLVMAFLWARERNRANEAVAKLEELETKVGDSVPEIIPDVAVAPMVDPVEMPPVEPVEQSEMMAPEGTFFLLTDMAIEDDGALTGFRAGTKLMKRKEGEYLSDGKVLKLRADQVTNDLRIVRHMLSLPVPTVQARPDPSLIKKRAPTPAPRAQVPTRLATREKNGWVWQKTPDGNYWTAVKRVDGKMELKPIMERAK